MLRDIAVVTGATVITEELGLKLEDATIEMLGRADKVIATKDTTVIVDGKAIRRLSMKELIRSKHNSEWLLLIMIEKN